MAPVIDGCIEIDPEWQCTPHTGYRPHPVHVGLVLLMDPRPAEGGEERRKFSAAGRVHLEPAVAARVIDKFAAASAAFPLQAAPRHVVLYRDLGVKFLPVTLVRYRARRLGGARRSSAGRHTRSEDKNRHQKPFSVDRLAVEEVR